MIGRKDRKKDDIIIMMDTSNIKPWQKAYYEQRKEEIYAKLLAHTFNKLQFLCSSSSRSMIMYFISLCFM